MFDFEINLWWTLGIVFVLVVLFFKLDVPNWLRGKSCTSNTGHVPVCTYYGMAVRGYMCKICKYRWYEDK